MHASVTTDAAIQTEIVLVAVSRKDYGWFVAESENLPGLFVSHPTLDQVMKDIPEVIKALYKHNRGLDIVAVQSRYSRQQVGEGDPQPWVTLPAHVANRGPQAG